MGKTFAIFFLTFTALILAGVAADLGHNHVANAQAGRFADYVMVPASTSSGSDALCVIDTVTQRMLFFEFDISQEQFLPLRGSQADLKKDFGRTE
ncbi:MAG: hypothetical protein JXL80_15400 [Planctomycetes bacterium]|nr:hypothetical protein [Planctomycetota bacterium]